MKLFYNEISSVVGKLMIVANEQALVAILWENEKPHRVPLDGMIKNKNHPIIQETEKQLDEYFTHKRTSFEIPLDLTGTDFQKKVWEELATIPYGTTVSYAQLAKQIGRPESARPLGAAVGKNPISIVIPCHRVIGTNGQLTGFAGGLKTKAFLLDLEKRCIGL